MFAQTIGEGDCSLPSTLTFVLFNTISFLQLEYGATMLTLLCSIPKSFGELMCLQGLCSLSNKLALQHFMHMSSPRAVFPVEELNHVSKGVVPLESYSTPHSPLLHDIVPIFEQISGSLKAESCSLHASIEAT
mgnify:CR=1 FL=1